MKSVPYTVTLEVDVYDARALIVAARAKAREDGVKLKHCTTREALQYLLDPGMGPPGTDIKNSACDKAEYLQSFAA